MCKKSLSELLLHAVKMIMEIHIYRYWFRNFAIVIVRCVNDDTI